MTDIFYKKILEIQPSQLYISKVKLEKILKEMDPNNPVLEEPIPIKEIDNELVYLDGHTRALAMYILGAKEVPVIWEPEEWDWEAYRICIKWCKEEGVLSIEQLIHRVVNEVYYQKLWLDRCSEMHKELEEKRKESKK